MVSVTVEIPDELYAQLDNIDRVLPQLIQHYLQQKLALSTDFSSARSTYKVEPNSSTESDDSTQGDASLQLQISDLEILLETITEHSTELENQLEERNRQLLGHLADLEIILETVTEHSTELENQLDGKNRELLSYFYEVEKVTAAAAAYENNTLTLSNLEEVAGRSDQLGQLARVFQEMVGHIKSREEKLAQQMRKLTIQIDRTKRDQEVSHIVESDMFKHLKVQADKLKRKES